MPASVLLQGSFKLKLYRKSRNWESSGCASTGVMLPEDMSTRVFLPSVTYMWTVTLPSTRLTSTPPGMSGVKNSRPLGFHVRNCSRTDTVSASVRPGSCKELVELKKAGNVCDSVQENVRLSWNGNSRWNENDETFPMKVFIKEFNTHHYRNDHNFTVECPRTDLFKREF